MRWGWHLCHLHCPAPRKGQGICSLDASSLGVCWLNKPNPARARVKCLDSSSLDYKGESMEKLKRGQKMCKNCSTINGVRSFNCKNCNHPFVMKSGKKAPTEEVAVITSKKVKRFKINKTRKIPVSDHTTLFKGDLIKVVQGSGPFHTDQDGNINYLGNKGKYTVSEILPDGIMVSSPYGSREFLYMGPEVKSPVMDSITRAPHKVILLKKADNGQG